jgi:DNA-directed RNA polymerase subunit K/omega
MKEDYFDEALEIVGDPYDLVNMIWERVRMLQRRHRPLVESLGKPLLKNVILREIIEGRITYVLGKIVVSKEIVGIRDIPCGDPPKLAISGPQPTSFCAAAPKQFEDAIGTTAVSFSEALHTAGSLLTENRVPLRC